MAIVATALAAAFGAAISSTMWIVAGIATAFQVGMYLYQQSQFDTSSSSPNYTFGPIQNTKTQKLPVPVVYGEMLIAGNIFYEKFKDDKCEEVDRFFGVSVGPVESITAVKIGDKLVEECEGCTLNIHLNTDSSTTDPLDPSGRKPYPIDNINSIAFISTHLKAGDDVSGGDVLTSIVKGKKVWTPSGTVWSDNPAWCIYDLLTNTVYGCGIPADRIDLSSFTTAAAYYDGIMSSGKKRFTLNYVIDTQKKAIDILGDMLAVCFSSLISREKIRLVPDAPVVSYSKRIGMADIKDGSFQWTQKSENERYNRIVVEWCDPDNSYEQVVSIFEDTADQAQRGVIEQSVNMLGCTNVDQANRTGARILDSSMGIKEFCTFKISLKNASVEVGDVVALSHDVPGWTDKWMRIIGITDVDNIEDEINVICAEYIAEVYDDVPMNVPVHIDTGIHGVYVPDNVSNITFTEQLEVQSDGTYIDWISVQWTNPSQNFSHLEMWYRFDTEANYTAGGNVSKTATEWRVNATGHSRLYVKIVTVGGTGKRSSGLVAMHTITGDVTPPATCINLTGIGGYKLANIKWTDPADNDLDHVDVYRSSDGNNYAVAGRSFRGEQAFIDSNLGILTNYWYKLKAVDSAGNESVFSSIIQVLTEAIPQSEIPAYSIDGHKTVTDIFGANEDAANAIIEQVLNNYGDTKDERVVIHDIRQEAGTTKASLLEVMQTVEGQTLHLTQLDTKTDTTNASVSQLSSVVNGLNAKWYVKVDSNGKIAGIALGNDSQSSDFTVLADKFFIYGTGTGGNELKQVFAVDTTTGKVVLQGDLLADGSITGAKINASAQITLGNGGRLIMGAGSVLQMASGAVVLDSESGVLQIKDPTNLTTGDYILITTGDIFTYRYINGQHRVLKSLRQIETGVAQNGTQVTLNGYWKNQPKIIVSPCALQCYSAANANANQQLYCYADAVSQPIGGIVTFTPKAELQIASGQVIINNPVAATSKYFGYQPASLGSIQTGQYSIPANVQNIKIACKFFGQYAYGISDLTLKYHGITATLTAYIGGTAYSMGTIAITPSATPISTEPTSLYVSKEITVPSGGGVVYIVAHLVSNSNDMYTDLSEESCSYAWLKMASIQYQTAAITQLAVGTLNYMAIAE